MTESSAAVDYLARTNTVHLATQTQDGREIVTKIWAVVVDGAGYIRNGYGDSSKWYGRIQRTKRAAFIDGRQRYPVTVENVDDEATNAKVDEAFRAKYAGSGSALTMMVAPAVRATTVRVDPE